MVTKKEDTVQVTNESQVSFLFIYGLFLVINEFSFDIVRQAAVRAVKRNKWSTSDSENDSIKSDDSDYQMSNVESEISDEHSDSNASSDFNPFNSDSDSDNDPWSRKKKGKKQKKSPKKRPSTQDKLLMTISQKTNKG